MLIRSLSCCHFRQAVLAGLAALLREYEDDISQVWSFRNKQAAAGVAGSLVRIRLAQVGDFQEAFDLLGVLPEVLAEGGVDSFVSGATLSVVR